MAILKSCDLTGDDLLTLVERIVVDESESGRLRIWSASVGGWTFDFFRGLDEHVIWYQAGRAPDSESKTARQALVESVEGRLFAPTGELRWRFIPALDAPFRTVFLGDTDWCPDHLENSDDIESLICTNSQQSEASAEVLLWGSQEPDRSPAGDGIAEWIELQIPHRLRYPVERGNGRRVYLHTETWTDERGEAQFTRFCDLHTK